jgi:nucleoside-diphosphate-sugar epimerase
MTGGRVVVTGAAGLIGQAAVRAFADAGWTVRAVDRKPDAPPGARGAGISWTSGSVHHISADALADVDAVVHLAAVTFEDSLGDDATPLLDVNVSGTNHLFRQAALAGVPSVVYASSQAVYAPATEYAGWPGGGPVPARALYAPPSLYGHTKLVCEGLADYYAGAGTARFLGIRPQLCYGLGRLTGVSGKFGAFLVDAIEGRPAVLEAPFGLEGSMDFIYDKDMAASLVRAVERLARPGAAGPPSRVVNAPTRDRLALRDVLDIVRRETGNPDVSIPEERCLPMIQAPRMDVEEAFELLGHEQRFPLAAAIADIAASLPPNRPDSPSHA